MVQVSEGSGGQVFLLDPSEVGSSATLLMASYGLDETLRRVVGDLEPGTRTIEVHIDGSVERVVFSVSLQCLQEIEIVRPSGVAVAAADPGITWTAFQAGRQVGLSNPEPGVWNVRLAGKGLLFFVAKARSAQSLDVRIVRPGGRPGHEGIVGDDTPLVPGTTRLMEVTVTPGIREPRLELRGSTDERLVTLPPVRPAADGDQTTYLLEFLVPASPFRVVVTGRDATGSTVQRAQSSLFQLSQSR